MTAFQNLFHALSILFAQALLIIDIRISLCYTSIDHQPRRGKQRLMRVDREERLVFVRRLLTRPFRFCGAVIFIYRADITCRKKRKKTAKTSVFAGLFSWLNSLNQGVRGSSPRWCTNIPSVRGIFVYYRGLRILCAVRRKQGALSRAFRTECERHKAT